jgi:hypothetical protein
MEALDMQLERFPAPGQADALDQQFILGDHQLAGVADFPVAGPAQTRGMLLIGSVPFASLWRMRSWRLCSSMRSPGVASADNARFTGVLTPDASPTRPGSRQL